jgi:hypothetical protein
MWTICHVTREYPEAFRHVSRGVDKMSQWSKSSHGKLFKVAVASKKWSDWKNNKKHPLYIPPVRSQPPESVWEEKKLTGQCHEIVICQNQL